MITQLLDHVGIVVRDMTLALQQYEAVLGLKPGHIETFGDGLLSVAFLPVGPQTEVGQTKIELLQPLRPGTSAWNFLHRHGEGIEHLAFLVGNVDQEINRLAQLPIPQGDCVSRPGAGGMLIAFLHPQALPGMLAELVTPITGMKQIAHG